MKRRNTCTNTKNKLTIGFLPPNITLKFFLMLCFYFHFYSFVYLLLQFRLRIFVRKCKSPVNLFTSQHYYHLVVRREELDIKRAFFILICWSGLRCVSVAFFFILFLFNINMLPSETLSYNGPRHIASIILQ